MGTASGQMISVSFCQCQQVRFPLFPSMLNHPLFSLSSSHHTCLIYFQAVLVAWPVPWCSSPYQNIVIYLFIFKSHDFTSYSGGGVLNHTYFSLCQLGDFFVKRKTQVNLFVMDLLALCSGPMLSSQPRRWTWKYLSQAPPLAQVKFRGSPTWKLSFLFEKERRRSSPMGYAMKLKIPKTTGKVIVASPTFLVALGKVSTVVSQFFFYFTFLTT